VEDAVLIIDQGGGKSKVDGEKRQGFHKDESPAGSMVRAIPCPFLARCAGRGKMVFGVSMTALRPSIPQTPKKGSRFASGTLKGEKVNSGVPGRPMACPAT
jgi:hypothetical protein